MSNSEVVAGQLITAASSRAAVWSTSAPGSPSTGQIWVDTSPKVPVVRIYNGTNWISFAGTTVTVSSVLTAVEGDTAATGPWSSVSTTAPAAVDITKPAIIRARIELSDPNEWGTAITGFAVRVGRVSLSQHVDFILRPSGNDNSVNSLDTLLTWIIWLELRLPKLSAAGVSVRYTPEVSAVIEGSAPGYAFKDIGTVWNSGFYPDIAIRYTGSSTVGARHIKISNFTLHQLED